MECPVCGNPNREGARFCDSCGSALSAAEAPTPTQQAEAPADLPGPVAGRYAARRFLGRGGRKDVYLAFDQVEEREVALAIFSTEGMDEAVLARARREMQAMERLGNSPQIVDVFDTGEEDGRPYIVSRYMPGGDVTKALAASETGRLEIEQALTIAIDVTRALEHAHARGVVHRDIKPANVWLGTDGRARLGDFGLAATHGRSATGGGVLVGTVAYLPPEQALGRRSGPRADLYSLGALLYEMIAGQPPFAGDDAVTIIGQHLNTDAVAPSRHNSAVPPALDRLVLRLLAKSPDQRPENAAAVREALEAIRGGEGGDEAATEEENPLESLAGGIFVGRERELSDLRGAVDDALAGRARMVLLSGEPGIGKTRTAEELATYARVRGAKVHWGRCHEGEGAPAYWPWTEALRSYVREADPVALGWEMGRGAADIARVVPDVAERLGIEEAPEPEDEQARFRLFDSVGTFLASAAAGRPLVVVLDDLHWADEPSLLLLRFLSRGLGDSGLLLIGTYREVELGRHHPLAGVLGELAGSERAKRVVLRGLDAEAVGRYVEMTTGTKPSPALVSALQAQTAGNPFFLGEVVRLLASEGRLSDPAAAAAGGIPAGVREVVGRRLDRLSEDANQVLSVGAAIGREFPSAPLPDLTGLEPAAVEKALNEATSAQLLDAPAPGRFRFSHALVRATLYGELTGAQRPVLHRKIADALEAIYAEDVDSHLSELAHHRLEAAATGDPGRAIEFATRAAERASRLLGYEEAAELYERALEVLELGEPDTDERCRLLLALGEAQTRAGRFIDARATLDRAAADARASGDPELLSRTALDLSTISEVGSVDRAIVALTEEALEEIGGEDSPVRARLLTALSGELYWDDPQGKAKPLGEEALAMARRLGDDRTLAFVLSQVLFAEVGPDGARRRLAMTDEIEQLAQRVGDRELEMRAQVLRLRDHLELGDVRAADRELEAYARLAAEVRQPQHLWHVPLLRGTRAIMDGRFKDAEELAAEALAGGERAGEPLARQFYGIQISLLRRHQGQLEGVLDPLVELAERYPAVPAWRTAIAAIYAELGRLEEARTELERLAVDDFGYLPNDLTRTVGLAILADVAARAGEVAHCERLHELLAPYSGQALIAGRAAACWGPVDRYLGVVSAACGKHDSAVGELESALALARRMGDRPMSAEIRYDLACVLLERGASGDRERALELLDQCLDAAQEMGMRRLTERALSAKLDAQGLAGVDLTSSIDTVIEAVESERPDIRAYAAPDGSVTILFSDIENSTLMTERLGDERWIEVLRDHNSIFRERFRERGGFEVKNQGDGFMLVFPDPREALLCAIEVQCALAEREAEEHERIRVRMGLHTGVAIADQGDFFGRNVILAARIAARAEGGEILVSEALKEQAAEENGVVFDDGKELELKGMAGVHRVYGVEWDKYAEPAAA